MSPIGSQIEFVTEDSPAMELGIKKGDWLISIDKHPIHDFLDLQFYAPSNNSSVEWFDIQGNQVRKEHIRLHINEYHGIELSPFKTNQCKNNCLFCFVRQLPKGMRKELYIKDEDYRLSFLFGNYITGSNLENADIERIINEKLSPIYISIHATNHEVRAQMLGNDRCIDILELLSKFHEGGISYHGQIVLCPGYNDGRILEQTLNDLSRFFPSLLSLAIVPVGLTDYRQNLPTIKRIDGEYSRSFIRSFVQLKKQLNHSDVFFLSDEFYLLAGITPPMYSNAHDLPQLDNGIGMYAEFYKNFKRHLLSFSAKFKCRKGSIKIAILTSKLGEILLHKFVAEFTNMFPHVHLVPLIIKNTVFGEHITVSGLLCGKDFLEKIRNNSDYDYFVIPQNSLRTEDDIFLDNMKLSELVKYVQKIKNDDKKRILIADDTARSFLDAIADVL